ncbi:hypothetical protein PV10_04495 [Exophiala mesophila]|uniref:Transport protein particle subunit trs85-2 n=1 Tax=Exophiala mesophila TaxID=212818 RepID=A0A0D1ZHH3_EXOME|nr:uncharacterized protein PV10_04495 [Exophiala mesophila]KIV93269.1 hypothetical protein PV10_04495 [Exophiala mesophila]
MTSPKDGDSPQTTHNLSSVPILDVRKTRPSTSDQSPETSTSSLPIRTITPPTLGSRTSTLSGTLSRSSSLNGRLSSSIAKFGRSSVNSPLANATDGSDDSRSLIVRAFSPTIGIYASKEVDELAVKKGLKRGFTDLIRPYGNKVTGKVVVRDSTGSSRAWEDFAIHFANLGDLAGDGVAKPGATDQLEKLEELMEYFIGQGFDETDEVPGRGEISPFYKLFLNRLLSTESMSPHESFRHPVGSVIAISSSTPQPVETIRNLYQQTAQGSKALPSWANPEYLRYYVLVHDEDEDDFSKSSALFDQMKRHFGLHCHLLRLRSTFCTQSDDDVEEVPTCEWLSPSEQLGVLNDTADLIDLDLPTSPFIFASDAVAIRAFVREIVAQSIVPYMENKILTWNDQIASRRRGISGRFISLSKRWTGIGSSARNASSATNLTTSGASGNYDSLQGSYRYDTSESLLRKLGDFSFMLRDYKLAASTYELLRTDYANDKAWKHLAGANEMCCVATLLNPLIGSSSSKFKIENFDTMLDTATYSYSTRCSEPALALRTILLGVELLKVRSRTATDLAAKWAIRGLELGLVGSVGHALISERVASCFADQIGLGSTSWGTRKRKAALWSIMTADEWMKLGRAEFASERLEEAKDLYNETKFGDSVQQYGELGEYLAQLQLAVRMKMGQARRRTMSSARGPYVGGPQDQVDAESEDEIVEQMVTVEKLDGRPRRTSLIGGGGGDGKGASGPEMTPLSPVRLARPDPLSRDNDDFE